MDSLFFAKKVIPLIEKTTKSGLEDETMSIYEMIHELNATCNHCTYGNCENCQLRNTVEKQAKNPKYEKELSDPNLKKWLDKNLELG